MRRQRHETAIKKLRKLRDKQFDLVWYARSRPDRAVAIVPRAKVQMKWPAEIEALEVCEDNWQHGFNSGVLAATRYALAYLEKPFPLEDEETGEPCPLEERYQMQVDAAERDYPHLDT